MCFYITMSDFCVWHAHQEETYKLIHWIWERACEYLLFNFRYNTHTPASCITPKETEEILKDVDWGRKKKMVCVWGKGCIRICFRRCAEYRNLDLEIYFSLAAFCLSISFWTVRSRLLSWEVMNMRVSLTSMLSILPKCLIWFGYKEEEADVAASFQKWEWITGKDGESSGKKMGKQDQHRSTVLLGGPG